jgi:hypothetical protein
MKTTTVKLYKKTKAELDSVRAERESYDVVISRLISHVKKQNLKKELIAAYKSMGQADLAILEEWESSSQEL